MLAILLGAHPLSLEVTTGKKGGCGQQWNHAAEDKTACLVWHGTHFELTACIIISPHCLPPSFPASSSSTTEIYCLAVLEARSPGGQKSQIKVLAGLLFLLRM